ncbi:MAG TPA: MFS transporter [Candidatus Binataceae bacterium]
MKSSALKSSMETAPAVPGLTPLQRRVWLLSAMGIFLDGFDLFIVAVALPLIAVQMHANGWALGLIASAAVIGAIAGALMLGRLADTFGRRKLFVVDLWIFALSCMFSALAWSVPSLIAFRFLAGVGVGADYPIAAAYLAEFMPARLRGRMLVAAFSFQAFGMLAGAAAGIAILLLHPSSGAWRWMLAAGLVPTLALVVARRGVPESEHWTRQAEQSASGTPAASYRSLFSSRYLRRTLLATLPWSLKDVTLYGVGMFTPTILAALSFVGRGSFMSMDIASTEGTALLDIFLLVGFALNIWLVERWGRIRLQVLGFMGMAIGLALLSLSDLQATETGRLALVTSGFAIFNLMVNAGPNATTYLISAELFPTELRASGHGLAAACGKLGAAVGIFFLPVLKGRLGLATTVAIAAAVSLAGLIITWMLGVETAGKSLEEVQHATAPAHRSGLG